LAVVSNAAQSAALETLEGVAARAAAQAAAENFPVAMRMLPATPRHQLQRVYAFARFVDDVGDEAPGDRSALLEVVDDQLRSVGTSTLRPVFGLGPVLAAGVSVQALRDLVTANRRDQTVTGYETFDDLLDYCRYSANPVGRIVLELAGEATEQNLADSDRVCSGLQVLEHCQDVGEDARAGRVYLPAADLRAEGADGIDLTDAVTPPALRATIALQVARADELVRAGRPLVTRLRGWARAAVAGYVAGGMATADALRGARYDVLARDIGPSKPRTAVHALRLLAGGRA
jgi:squalene synthase HpnC